MVSAGHVGGTRGSNIVSSASNVLLMSVVRGMRGVGGVCEFVYVFGSELVDGEWMRGLGLGFISPVGTWGVLDVCLCFGCGGVGEEWVGDLDHMLLMRIKLKTIHKRITDSNGDQKKRFNIIKTLLGRQKKLVLLDYNDPLTLASTLILICILWITLRIFVQSFHCLRVHYLRTHLGRWILLCLLVQTYITGLLYISIC